MMQDDNYLFLTLKVIEFNYLLDNLIRIYDPINNQIYIFNFSLFKRKFIYALCYIKNCILVCYYYKIFEISVNFIIKYVFFIFNFLHILLTKNNIWKLKSY